MIIDLTKIPSFLITVENQTERHQKLNKLFSDKALNVQHIYGKLLNKDGLSFMEIQTKKSSLVAEAHIEALKITEPPFIIFEDDVDITPAFKSQIEIPDDTDAFYLGTSIWGMYNGKSMAAGTRGHKINSEISKVHGMLGIHAVVYITKSYVESTINNLNRCISANQFCDECIAEDMKNHNVYCVNDPYFYQDDGHNNAVTLMPFRIYLT